MKKISKIFVCILIKASLFACGNNNLPSLPYDVFNFTNEVVVKANDFATICPLFNLEKEQVILTTTEFNITNKYMIPLVYGELYNYTADDFKEIGVQPIIDHIQELAKTRALSECLYREAIAAGITVSDISVDAKVNEFMSSDLAVMKELERTPFTIDFIRQDFKYTIAIEDYKELIINKCDSNVSDKEAKKYYANNPSLTTRPKRAIARHIYRDISKMTEEQKTIAFEEMKKLRAEITSPEDFLAKVEKYSDDDDTKKNGGLVAEYIEPGQSEEEIENAIFSQPNEGGISDVVVSSFGYHIFMVDSITPEYRMPYEEISEQIKKIVYIERQNKAIDDEIERVTKKYRIKEAAL